MNKTDQQKNNKYINYWTENGKSSKEINRAMKIAITTTYKDSKGKNRIYIPDLIVVLEDGSVEVHEIKPKAMLIDIDVQKKAQACRAFATKTFEQKVKYKFITEKELFKTNKEYIDFINNVAKKWNKIK